MTDNKIFPAIVEENEGFSTVRPDQTYKGMTYSDLIKDWWNWIFSADPDFRQDNNIMFLRGNIGADYKKKKEDTMIGKLEMIKDPAFIFNRTGLNGITISTKTSIFFPVYDSQFVINDRFEGKQVETTYECRVAARRDFQMLSSAWATTYTNIGKNTKEKKKIVKKKIVNQLSDYYAESSPFGLIVSDRSKLKDIYDGDILQPGAYEGVAVGIYILICNLEAGRYRFDFGGISRINYVTRAVYDVTVVDAHNEFELNDVDASQKMLQEDFSLPF